MANTTTNDTRFTVPLSVSNKDTKMEWRKLSMQVMPRLYSEPGPYNTYF